MGEQHAPAGIARRTLNRKKSVQFADQILQWPQIRLALRIEKTHAQRNLVVAQTLRYQRRTLLLAWRESAPAQPAQQMIQYLVIDKG